MVAKELWIGWVHHGRGSDIQLYAGPSRETALAALIEAEDPETLQDAIENIWYRYDRKVAKSASDLFGLTSVAESIIPPPFPRDAEPSAVDPVTLLESSYESFTESVGPAIMPETSRCSVAGIIQMTINV